MSKDINITIAGDLIPTNSMQFDKAIINCFSKSDFSIANLETTLTEAAKPILKTGKNFKKSPGYIKQLKKLGLSGVTLANNHIRDFNDQGVVDTITKCHEEGIKTVGAGININDASKPLIISVKSRNICILNYAEQEFNIASENQAGANPFDALDAFYQIREQKKKNDFVVVIYHGSLEYMKYPTPSLVKISKFLVDSGADTVIAHHSHFYNGMIQYKDKPLIFGLGNFYAETSLKNPSRETKIGLLAKLIISKNDQISASLIPTIQNTSNKTIKLLEGKSREEIKKDISAISSTILNVEKFTSIWDRYYIEEERKLLHTLSSSSRLEYRIRKYLPFMKIKLSKYRLLTLLNFHRCESHRNKNIAILENLYDKTN